MSDAFGVLVQLAIIAVPLALGAIAGTAVARAHRRDLARREAALARIVVSDLPRPLLPVDAAHGSHLVLGQVALGCDHARRLVGGLASILGGEVRTFSSLYERARREALVRLRQQAADLGCDEVVNVRFDTSTIGMGGNVTVEVLASGTAVRRAR